MRFLIEDIKLELQPEANSVTYMHTIKSELLLNGKRTVNTSEKVVDTKIIREENRYPKFRIKTTGHVISLDNLLKKQEKIILRMANLTDTVLLGIDQKGIIKNIHNHTIIVQKWEVLKQELKEFYTGNAMDRYILGIDRKIKDETKLLEDFRQARLFGLLFNGLYDSYNTSKKVIRSRIKAILNTVDHIPIIINEDIFCDHIDTRANTILLRLKGKLNTEQTYVNKIENHLIRKGVRKKSEFKLSSYNGVFQFDTTTGLMINSSLIIETMFGEGYKKRDQLEMKII